MLLLVVLVALAFAGVSVLVLPTLDLNQTGNGTANGGLGSLAGIGDTGSGGGGSGGTPAPAGGDEGCVGDCPAVWVEDAPIKTARSGGLLDMFKIGDIAPILAIGEWNCEGTCKDEDELCIFNPTDVIPDGGYDNPNSPPNCVCLKPAPGSCNFYDANYGVGAENIVCGGSCPLNSQCMKFNADAVDVCRCLKSYGSDDCGLHYPEQYLQSSSGEYVVPGTIDEDDCYGFCDIATLCTFDYDYDFDTKAKVPICYCPESPVDNGDNGDPDYEIRPECETILNPFSQKDCDIGACKVLLYDVQCLFQENKLGGNECYCGILEDEPEEPLLTTTIVDKLLSGTNLDFFLK